MKRPAYLTALNLSALPVDYEWDDDIFAAFWECNDEDNPRLAEALELISIRAAFALGVACSEWVVARVEGHTDITDALLRIEAAWAATIDQRYAKLPPPSEPSVPSQYASPLHLAMKLLSYAHERFTSEAEEVSASAQGLVMMVDHIAGRHQVFEPWLSESLRRCNECFPASEVPVEQEQPVPKELFEPDFDCRENLVQEALRRFIQTLDPARNPYLCSAEEMLTAGFEGSPYSQLI